MAKPRPSQALENRRKPTIGEVIADQEERIGRLIQRPANPCLHSHVVGLESKVVTWPVKANGNRIEILHMTDLQWGHRACRKDRVIEYRNWILSRPNRYVVLGGDMIDAATAFSPGSQYDNDAPPQFQVYSLCEMLAPMAHRILGYVGGNHERRGIPAFGDLGLLIARTLHCPYSSGQQFVRVQFGKHTPFVVFLYHGRGAARTAGAKMQMLYHTLVELSAGANVTLVGHLHDAMMKWLNYRYVTSKGVETRKVCVAMSSSFLDYMGTYAEVAGLSPAPLMQTRIVLEKGGGWEVTLR